MRSARGYINLKGFVAKAIKKIPLIGKPLKNSIERVKNAIKYLFIPNEIFEQMGFKYYGIVDGHDIADLEKIFEHVRHIDEPVIVHVKTQKGQGRKAIPSSTRKITTAQAPSTPKQAKNIMKIIRCPLPWAAIFCELAGA